MKSLSQYFPGMLRLLLFGTALGIALLIAVHMLFFAVRSDHLLSYPYPLDYGEGPLLAQVQLLRAGTPIWHLYADPDQAPYLVVNYPPGYLLTVATVDMVLPVSALFAGRLVSLLAALGAAAAIGWIVSGVRGQGSGVRRVDEYERRRRASRHAFLSSFLPFSWSAPPLAALFSAGLFLSIGIVREWASVMRVDMLGLCLGLWGLVIVQRCVGSGRVLWAAPLFALSLLCKPTLVAAPLAAGLWLLFRGWRWAVALGMLTAVLLGFSIALMQAASGGWFFLHVFVANTNAWDGRLAQQFWQDHMLIMRPLMLAAVLGFGVWGLGNRAGAEGSRGGGAEEQRGTGAVCGSSVLLFSCSPVLLFSCSPVLLALYYTLFGLMTAFGIGKLGAYANYFLEAYAGLVALVGCGLALGWNISRASILPPRLFPTLAHVSKLAMLGLCGFALLRYYPLWSQEFLMPAGVIEGANPARGSFGQRGIWQDLQREAFVLQAKGRINAALQPLTGQSASPIFTDVPAVAVQNGRPSRVQMFEHRMLYDAGAWDQRPVLRELANGQLDLVVLDYLGNWMTPEMITILTKRYAQDISVGTYSIYRPVKIGPQQPLHLSFPNGLLLESVALTPPISGTNYAPAEIVPITLGWRNLTGGKGQGLEVVLRLLADDGRIILEDQRPLIYTALTVEDWGDQTIEHMQPLRLPDKLAPGHYKVQMTLSERGRKLADFQELASLHVASSGEQLPGQAGRYFVPEAFLSEWEQHYSNQSLGEPQMPAVQFEHGMLQCFERACLRLTHAAVERVPLGEMVWLADAGFPAAPVTALEDDEQLLALWQALGGEQSQGPLLGQPLIHFGYLMQYSRYGRLERFLEGGAARLGNVGRDVLRLPGDSPYRWP